jgi:hypothetical protein
VRQRERARSAPVGPAGSRASAACVAPPQAPKRRGYARAKRSWPLRACPHSPWPRRWKPKDASRAPSSAGSLATWPDTASSAPRRDV